MLSYLLHYAASLYRRALTPKPTALRLKVIGQRLKVTDIPARSLVVFIYLLLRR